MSPICDFCFHDTNNIGVQLSKDLQVSTVEMPLPQILPHEVLIHVKCTGICGSDIHLWKHGGIGDLTIKGDIVLGHEAAGQVLAVGTDVHKDLNAGDKVAIEPQLPCGKCYLCIGGDYNLCQKVKFLGMPPDDGTMRRFIALDQRCVFKLPEKMTYEEGAMMEVLSVGYHGIQKAGGIDMGKPVYISGAGPIGLATMLLANAAGACPIVVGDISCERLELAKSMIPQIVTYEIDSLLNEKENAAAIKVLFGREEEHMPADVLECTGFESSVNTCAYVVRRNGRLTILGVSSKSLLNSFPFMHLSFAEVDIKFVNRYHQSWPPVINLIDSGKIDVQQFVTHKFDISEASKAFETVFDKKISSLKVLVTDTINLV